MRARARGVRSYIGPVSRFLDSRGAGGVLWRAAPRASRGRNEGGYPTSPPLTSPSSPWRARPRGPWRASKRARPPSQPPSPAACGAKLLRRGRRLPRRARRLAARITRKGSRHESRREAQRTGSLTLAELVTACDTGLWRSSTRKPICVGARARSRSDARSPRCGCSPSTRENRPRCTSNTERRRRPSGEASPKRRSSW